MRDFDLDDRFWRDAIQVLVRGHDASALSDHHPLWVELLEELKLASSEGSLMVGARTAISGDNPRLLMFLAATYLARAGKKTLLIDLSPELRWLERVIEQDLKEGMIDHIQFQVPLERCIRQTAIPGLSVLSGGAYFLTGSPLDDPPALRATLEGLRGEYNAIVLTLPRPVEAADEAGIAALCDVLLTIEDREAETPLLGCEQAVVRLSGDPQVACEIANATSRFTGPLTDLIGAGFIIASASEDLAGQHEHSEEVAFLSAFEGRQAAAGPAPPEPVQETVDSTNESHTEPVVGKRNRARGRITLGVAAVVIAAVVLGAGALWLMPLVTNSSTVVTRLAESAVAKESIEIGGGQQSDASGVMVPLVPGPPSGTESTEPGTEPTPVPDPLEVSLPFSVHVGSYQEPSVAHQAADEIEARGHSAFVAPVQITEKGIWNRVYVGAFADSDAASRALIDLVEEGIAEEGRVLSTEWAFLIETFDNRRSAEDRRQALRTQGISTYLMGTGPVRLYSGAYESTDDAELLRGMLETAAASSELTERRGSSQSTTQ